MIFMSRSDLDKMGKGAVKNKYMFKIVRKDEGIIRKVSEEKAVCNLISKDISEDVSLAIIETTDGFHDKEVSQNNRIYYVLEGRLELKFGDILEILEKGDSCFISRTTEYKMNGVFKAIVINQPAFGIKN